MVIHCFRFYSIVEWRNLGCAKEVIVHLLYYIPTFSPCPLRDSSRHHPSQLPPVLVLPLNSIRLATIHHLSIDRRIIYFPPLINRLPLRLLFDPRSTLKQNLPEPLHSFHTAWNTYPPFSITLFCQQRDDRSSQLIRHVLVPVFLEESVLAVRYDADLPAGLVVVPIPVLVVRSEIRETKVFKPQRIENDSYSERIVQWWPLGDAEDGGVAFGEEGDDGVKQLAWWGRRWVMLEGGGVGDGRGELWVEETHADVGRGEDLVG